MPGNSASDHTSLSKLSMYIHAYYMHLSLTLPAVTYSYVTYPVAFSLKRVLFILGVPKNE